jgi:methylmalonyl-CoA mutase cobalamin-binding domain/chain
MQRRNIVILLVMKMIDKLEYSIINLDIERATDACKELVKSSMVPIDEIFRAIGRALDVVGQKYEEGEYFLSELIMAGEVVKEGLKLIEPIFKRDEKVAIATVVLATVRGDLHDIGKNIFAMLLQSSGFKVIDLGIDISAENIVKAVRKNNAEILGLSFLLTTTLSEIENVIGELNKAGLRDKVKVIVGGAALNEDVVDKNDVDAWGKTAVDGLRICRRWFS